MKITALQHVAFEEPGAVQQWAETHGHSVRLIRVFDGEPLPDPADVEFLVVLGGPMSVNDEQDLPWLVDEKAFVRAYIASGNPCLGICLGAQLMACTHGAEVYRARRPMVGWYPVQGWQSSNGFSFPPTFTPLHWHGETFDLPKGAECLASTELVPNQAFRLGENAYGLQFHIEATRQTTQALMEHDGNFATLSWRMPGHQHPATVVGNASKAHISIHPILYRLLDHMAEGVKVER